MIKTLGDQAVKKMMGTGISAQFLSSILYSADLMLIAFFASALFGFALLMLYAYEPFVCVMAYTMVFFVMIVLLIGALVVNNMYWDSMKSMNALDIGCFPEITTVGTTWFFTTD